MAKIDLGVTVKDKITGLVGVVMGRKDRIKDGALDLRRWTTTIRGRTNENIC